MESIWSQTCEIRPREALPGDIKTDVAVIGAGLAGILTAAALQEAGCGVAVLEAGRIASGQTGNTTAKITCQHGLIYHRLIRSFGKDRARLYAEANQTAAAEYRRMISSRSIDCDFEERDSFVYGNDAALLRREAEAACALGLPASFVKDPALPFPAAGAVHCQSQAQFHPLKFIKALAEPLTVYETTPVLRVDGNVVVTKRGQVQARHIVFACHFPFVNFPGLYFARMHQERSYVLALENAGPARACGSARSRAVILCGTGRACCCWAAGATAAAKTAGAGVTGSCAGWRRTVSRGAGSRPAGRPRTA